MCRFTFHSCQSCFDGDRYLFILEHVRKILIHCKVSEIHPCRGLTLSVSVDSTRILIFRWMASILNSSQYLQNNAIREATSTGSRCQFSVENAYTLRYWTPSAMHHLAKSTSVLLPSQWPYENAFVGYNLFLYHCIPWHEAFLCVLTWVAFPYLLRPYLRFPSIMTATWRGSFSIGTPLSRSVCNSLRRVLLVATSFSVNTCEPKVARNDSQNVSTGICWRTVIADRHKLAMMDILEVFVVVSALVPIMYPIVIPANNGSTMRQIGAP